MNELMFIGCCNIAASFLFLVYAECRKWVTKVSEWDETIKTEADAKLRAMVLNWEIVKMEVV